MLFTELEKSEFRDAPYEGVPSVLESSECRASKLRTGRMVELIRLRLAEGGRVGTGRLCCCGGTWAATSLRDMAFTTPSVATDEVERERDDDRSCENSLATLLAGFDLWVEGTSDGGESREAFWEEEEC